MRRSGVFLCGALLAFATDAWSEEGRQAVEAEIQIDREDDAEYFEHRVNGVLKEIKVVPKVGPSYYLVPADGGGWIREEKSTLLVPKWVLFEW